MKRREGERGGGGGVGCKKDIMERRKETRMEGCKKEGKKNGRVRGEERKEG